MVIFPKAKINIGLRITAKRSDGYHDLETIFYPVGLCDALEFVVPAESPGKDILTITGIPVDGNREDNIVLKALEKMREVCHIPFLLIHLHKMIPSGAGLGGGSSDAASFLKVLNRYFCTKRSNEQLKEIALSLGSDCPFFIDSRPSYAEGRGEIMSPLENLPGGIIIVILKPMSNISTREAFSGCVPGRYQTKLPDLYREDIKSWKDLITNDFEKSVFRSHPEVRELNQALYSAGALFSSMTGSGSAVYGLFDRRPEIPENLMKFLVYEGAL